MGWQGRGRACPQPELRVTCEAQLSGERAVPASQDCSGLSVDTWWLRAGSGLAPGWPLLPMPVLAAGGPCPRGGDQGFAGSLETELMYLQMMMEILFLFVLFCF